VQLPVHDPNHPPERSAEAVRELALAIQSNLARLRDRDARNAGVAPEAHDIRVPDLQAADAPAGVIIDGRELDALPAEQVHLRLHEVWGQFCLMCWLFGLGNDPNQADFAPLLPDAEPLCRTVIEAKHAEVHALLWRIVFEQRKRHDAGYEYSPRFPEDQAVASIIPANAFGTPVDRATDAELVLAACEHAGMLAVLRWLLDTNIAWNDPALTVLDDRPF